MPRPKNKPELLLACDQTFDEFTSQIGQFTTAQLKSEFPGPHRDRNARDVLAHLHAWHLLFLKWYDAGMRGESPLMPAKGHTWRTTPILNQQIHAKYQRTSLPSIQKKLNESHTAICLLAAGHTDAELFQKCLYPWTGSTSLGSYIVSATSAHYAWGTKLLKKQRRLFG